MSSIFSIIFDLGISNCLTLSYVITIGLFYLGWKLGWLYLLFFMVFMIYFTIFSCSVSVTSSFNTFLISDIIHISMIAPPTVTFSSSNNNDQPLHLIMPPPKPTIYLYAPHGQIPTGAVWLIGHPIFKHKTVLLVAKQLLQWWLANLVCYVNGYIMEINETNINWCLQHKLSVIIVIGGIREMLMNKPETFTSEDFVLYSQHTKIYDIANKNQVSITPILCDGQSSLHMNPYSAIARFCYQWCKIPFSLSFTNDWGIPISNRIPLHLVIGNSIDHATKEKVYTEYKRIQQQYFPHRKMFIL